MTDVWVLHADMDAFYASIEQRDHPELRGKPVIVGANSARGVVSAASYEARRYGVRSAMPGFRARQLCPEGVFVQGDMAHYAAVSAEIHAVFQEFTSEIEPIALDEAFLDITGSLRLFGGPRALAESLKRAVRRKTELAVSVGLANSKLVAKIACTLGKPDGLAIVERDQVESFLAPLPVRRLWGVGPVFAAKLQQHGFHTVGDLQRAEVEVLKRHFGTRASELRELAHGRDSRPVESDRAPKSYGEENTFERDVSAREIVTAALTSHAESVASRLRADGYRGRTVTLKIKLGRARQAVHGEPAARAGRRISRVPGEGDEPDYPLLSRSRTLQTATDDASTIREVAIALWDEAAIREPVRLLGVSLSRLETHSAEQLELFAPSGSGRLRAARTPGSAQAARLGPTLDAIHARFGKSAITRAVDAPLKLTPTGRKKRGEP